MFNCSNTRVERTPNKSQHTQFTLEKKISRNLSITSPVLYQQAIPAPFYSKSIKAQTFGHWSFVDPREECRTSLALHLSSAHR